MRFSSLGLVAALASLVSINSVNAHPLLVLPAHHASLLAVKAASHVVPFHGSSEGIVSSQSLLTFLTKSKGSTSLGALAISGSAKALVLQDKQLVANGFNAGLASLANSVVTNGALKGNVYFFNGATYSRSGVNTFFVGNNPLNVGGSSSPFPLPTVGSSFITLSGTKGSASSLISFLGKSGANASLASASSRAALARIKSITESSAKLGLNANGGVITDGQLSGTFYDGTGGGNYFQTGKLILALGNNPLNVNTPATFMSTNPASYLDFGKYRYNISSGELFPTVYFSGQREGLILALGSDKLNSYPGGPTSVFRSSLLSTLIGKLLVLK